VPDDEIVQFYDMLYADIQLLEDWFGARLTLNFSQSLLTLSTQQKLPFEKRIERGERIIGQRHLPQMAENPLLDNPYKLAEVPSLDLSASHMTQRNDNTDAETLTRTHYSVISHGDLGYMNSEVFVSGEREEGLLSATARLQRYDHSGSMLGPLGATHVGLGDISSPGIPLAPGGGSGRGIVIDNKDLSFNKKSDLRIIDGDYHPGWDIELYQNGIVVGHQTIGEDGHYEFTDMPLFLGHNRFTLKFYGPGGREEVEERTLFLGANQDDVGKLKYSASLFQPALKTININDVNDVREAYEQALISAQYGLTPTSSLHTGFLHKDIATDEAKNFYNFGLQSSLWNTNLLFDMTRDDQGNNTYAFSANQNINRTSLRLGIIEYDRKDHVENRAQRQLSFGVSGQILNTPYNFSGRRDVSLNSTEDTYNFGVSGSIDRLRWSNSLKYISQSNPEGSSDSLDGNLFLGYSLRPINFRLGLNYRVNPETVVDSADLATFFSIDDNTSINLSARYRPGDNSTRYNLGLTWKLPYIQLTPTVSYSDNGEILGQITVSASLGKRSSHQRFHYNLDGNRQANQGTFKARLFEDLNSNGYYEIDEPLLEGGELKAVQGHRKGRSNSEGVAWLEQISAWQQTDIAYKPGSVAAAPMVYTGKPFSVVLRPGSVMAVNMPFTRTGEIDGTVYRKKGPFTTPARGVRMSLYNSQGDVVEHTTTDAHGFFLFEELMPSDYRLQAMNEAWLEPEEAKFTITSKGNAILDKQLLLGPTPPLRQRTITSLLDSAATNSALEAPVNAVKNEPLLAKNPEEKKLQNFWALQVASYRDPQNAQKLEQRLVKQGHPSFSRTAVIGGRNFTRVYAGKQINRARILAIKDRVDRSIEVNSIVVKLSAENPKQ